MFEAWTEHVLPYLSHPPHVVCLEEPENGIHPRDIETVLESLSSLYDSQVWLSTHSPIVLAHTDLKSVIVMRSDGKGSVEAVAGDKHPQLQDWKGGIDLGSLFAAGVLERQPTEARSSKRSIRENPKDIEIPRSGAIYSQITSRVSIKGYTDQAFRFLYDTLRQWFPPDEDQ